MTLCLPPLSAPVRPESHPGDPVTANTTAKIATDDLSASTDSASIRSRAERLLLRVADHGEKLLDNTTDPLDVPDYLVMTLVETGRALVQLAELDAQQPSAVEVLLDRTGDLWVLVGDDKFECQTRHCEHQALEQIRRAFGIAREFVAAPRPAC